MAFLYTNNELPERETKKTILFTVASNKIKYIGINLTKDVKGLYSQNYKTLKTEIEEDTNKWKHTPCSWIGRINIIKMSIVRLFLTSMSLVIFCFLFFFLFIMFQLMVRSYGICPSPSDLFHLT